MTKLTKKVLTVFAKVVEIRTNEDKSGWPPPCAGYIYQPKRPKKKIEIIE